MTDSSLGFIALADKLNKMRSFMEEKYQENTKNWLRIRMDFVMTVFAKDVNQNGIS